MSEKRLYFIDLLRLTAMVAIAHFHTHEFFFYNDQHLLRGKSFLNTALEPYSRVMSFSGFTIVILSFFLFGYHGLDGKKWKKLLFICLAGVIVLVFASYDKGFYFEWDIYSYVLTSVFIVRLLSFNKIVLKLAALLSFVALCLPRAFFLGIPGKDSFFYNALFGNYEALGAGSWPLIPWIGLPVLFYYLGIWIRKNQERFKKITNLEGTLWLIMGILTLPQLGGYYQVAIGPNFYNYTFNRGTLFFWSHIFWIIFLVRLSLVPKINQFFLNRNIFSWISRLELNKSFFLFYITHLFIISIFSNFSDFFLQHPWWIDVFLLALFPVTELLCKAFKISLQIVLRN